MSRSGTAPAGPNLGSLIESLLLVRIRLRRLIVNAARVDEVLQADDGAIGIHTKAGLIGVAGDEATFEVGVRVWAPQATSPTEAPLLIVAERSVIYSGVPNGTTPKVLEEFCRGSVLLAGWPYLRRDVHEACLEIDVPPLLLPLVKAPSLVGRDDLAAGRVAVAWNAYRVPLLEAIEEIAFLFDHRHGAALSRVLRDELSDERWGLAVRALDVEHRSIVRRLHANLRDDETRPFLGEIWEFVRELENFVAYRRTALKREHAEALTRWDEFAAAMERTLRSAWKAGLLESTSGPKLRRFGR